jgi:hypothetical protein
VEVFIKHNCGGYGKNTSTSIVKCSKPVLGENNLVFIDQGDPDIEINKWEITRFSGNIKNKHELEVILKQIGI